jgi:hypothetical protein
MTNVDKVSALLDALADHKGMTLDGAAKAQIAVEFTGLFDLGDPPLTNEDIAGHFLDGMVQAIVRRGRENLRANRIARLADEEATELDAGACNFNNE